VDYRGRGANPLRWTRVFHSNLTAYRAQFTIPAGTGWRNYYDRSIQVLSPSQVRLHRANGRTLDFTFNGSAWTSTLPAGVLTGVGSTWQYVNHRDRIETYGSNGRLSTLGAGGLVTTMQYDAYGRLVAVINAFGRRLSMAYDGSGRIAAVTLPDGNTLSYGYDSRNNLISTRFADGAVRQYLYENASFPNALTGVIDETGRRRLTWGYDSAGRPNYGHYGAGTNPISVSYGNGQVTTTDALGTQRTRTFATVGSRVVLTGLQTSATADTAATAWTFNYDGNGNLASATTRTGEVQQYMADARGRFLTSVRAAGSAIALPTQTIWHSTFRKPTQVVRAGVTRNATIDGAGRVTLVTQTAGGTTAAVLSRVYNAQGLLQSVTDARGATKTYTYDASGNRTSVTDALNQTTYFQNFSAHGQATRVQRSDGTIITRSFDTRGRLIARTVSGRTTVYAYDAAGRLLTLTRPDGSWRTRAYDAGGYLTGITNQRGETTAIARDVTGRVVGRNVYSATGALAQTRGWRYNGRGLPSAVVDSRNNQTRLLYGNDGRASGTVDALGLTRTLQLDLLNRLVANVQPNTTAMRLAGGPATVSSTRSYHPTYATHQNSVDTNAVVTGFGYDSFNRKVAEAGADAGGKSLARNAAGDVQSVTDARGVTLVITRDALGRITLVTPPSGTALKYTYVAGRSDNLLASMTDPSGSTVWTYDSEGRVLSKTQTVGGVARKLTATRDSLGRISGMVYPSGLRLDVTYAGDLVSALAINGTTLLSNVSYRPQSQTATGWRWGNGSSFARVFDADGRIASVTVGSVVRTYSFDAAGRIVGQSDVGAAGTKTTTFNYDEAGQLTTAVTPTGSISYTYDANGNQRSLNWYGMSYSNTYVAGSNRLLTSPNASGFAYLADGSPSTDGYWNFSYDSYGRMTGAAAGSVADGTAIKVTRSYNGRGMRVSSITTRNFAGATPAATMRPGVTPSAGQRTSPPSTAGSGFWATLSTRHFFDNDAGQLLGEYDTINGYSQETVWFNGHPVAASINGTLYHVYADNLGTPRSLVRASDGLEMWRWDSDPFGVGFPSAPSAAGRITYNLRFPGQYYDETLGYHYNWMRDYSPWSGRYLQPDPLGLGGGLARYSYAGGNPLSYMDPSGEFFFLFVFGPGVGAALGDGLLFGSILWSSQKSSPPGGTVGAGGSTPDPGGVDRCRRVQAQCRAKCSDSVLPTGDSCSQGFPFFQCVNDCVAEAGC
jgi:RHS repeat-associated protein